MKSKASEILFDFTFAVFKFVIESIDPLHLPGYKGSALRGGFGHTFRRVVCPLKRQNCGDCELSNKCVYSYIFETRPLKNDPFLRNVRDKVAHPYIIRPPLDDREEYEHGEEIEFELVLIGKAMDYLPYFAYTFIQMGENGLGRGKGKFMLKSIDSVGLNVDDIRIYHCGDEVLKNTTRPVRCEDLVESFPPPGQCTFRFLTRLELKEKRKYPEISFGTLFRRLLARITTLAHLHCGIDCTDFDFSGLSHTAEEIKTVNPNLRWEHAIRYSNRQMQRMPFGGLLGEITFEGNLAPFWPFILLGEWVHVGKKTSFGLGRYELVREFKN